MCIENLLVGMRTFPKQTPINLAVNEFVRLENNPSRIGFILVSYQGLLQVSTQQTVDTAGWGFISSASQYLQNHVFRIQDYGQLITGNIYIIADGGLALGTVTELIVEPATMEFILSRGK